MADSTVLDAMVEGLRQALAPQTLMFLVAGVLAGGVVGVLPGLGGAATIAMLLPFAFDLPAPHAFALLLALVAVAATTGDLTSILLGVPGEATTAATILDGYPLARTGQAGRAIGASLASSVAGSTLGAAALALSILVVRPLAMNIGSPELFLLAVLGVCSALPLTSGSRLRGLIAGAFGLALATIGQDPLTGTPRFAAGILTLWDGLSAIPVAIGLFAVPELVSLAGRRAIAEDGIVPSAGVTAGIRDAVRCWPSVLRSSAIGVGVGLLPGAGGSISQWFAYNVEARRAKRPEQFGQGAIEGVIAPSAANNATLGGALVPTLALGIPGSLTSAMLLSALVLKGLTPGPQLLLPEAQGGHLGLVFGMAWMIAVANLIACGVVLAGHRWLVSITHVSSALLVPILLVMVCLGAFAERNALEDLLIMMLSAAVGIAMSRYEWPRSPLLLGLVLGPLAEGRLFLTLQAYGASWLIRPGVLLIAAIAGLIVIVPLSKRRQQAGTLAQSQPRRGESVFAGVGAVVCLTALLATAPLPAAAALFPRVTFAVTFVLLATLLLQTYRSGPTAGQTSPSAMPRASAMAAASVPAFVSLVWLLGFAWGASIGVLGYIGLVARERLRTAVIAAAVVWFMLDVAMARVLHVPFPAGTAFTQLRGW